ncbi:MAG TPA: HAMP domain-containing sensor histidine kinase, partial [Candidatus Limnocylindrales bacterium]|nr:HAMP domain-containing sensor histidine kinase [Candidatus Limnocylindrales bacterium]
GPSTSLRRSSIRVALAAAGVVAVIYLAVAVAVALIVQRALTDQVDQRITSSFVRLPHDGPQNGNPYEAPPPERFGAAPVILWEVQSDGTVVSPNGTPALPAAYTAVTGPVTATIEGSELRLAGRKVNDDWIVIGQSLEQVNETRASVVLAELVIAPILLGVVFLGAVAIGRRVAEPIETARQRQLDFTADASHELRTPLAVIEAHTSLALAQPRDVEWYRSAFGRVDRESKRMRRMLEDLLWLARFDATQRSPHAEPVNLSIMAAQAVDRFGPIAETRHLAVEMTGASDGAVIAASPEWLDRLLGVLLDNATKYAPEGGRVAVSVTVEGNRVALAVDDNGPGIPEAERTRIFDRFHRATDARGGAGLGLAIADAIVRATGGRWRVGESPGGGARMAISWSRALS